MNRRIVFILNLLCHLICGILCNNVDNSRSTTKNTSNTSTNRSIVRRKWLTQIFLEAEAAFDVHPNVSSKCKKDFNLYKLNLQNQSVWAVRMLESAEWPSVGLFAGTIHHMGNYDECLLVSEFDFVGQYCIVRATYNFTVNGLTEKNHFSWSSWPNEESSAWGAIDTFSRDFMRLNRRTISWALCIPSTCSVDDLKMSLNRTLFPIFKNNSLDVRIDINPLMCRVKETPPLTKGFFIVGAIFGTVFTFEICASIYDLIGENRRHLSRIATIFRYFSFIYNYKTLTKFSTRSSIPIFHVTKIIVAGLILTQHRIMLFYFFPVFNAEIHEMKSKRPNLELLHTNIVDFFLCISGYSLYVFAYPSLRKVGIIFGIRYIIFRWMRLMVVPGAVILIIVNVSRYLNDGPVWNFYVDKFVGYCESNWWTTIFAINNIVKPDQPCLPHTWYLSVDLQLTLFGIILLYVMSKRRKIAIALAILFMIISFIIVYIIIVVNKFPGLPLFSISYIRDITKQPIFYSLYVTSYLRLGPYLIGIFAAMVTEKLKTIRYKFSTKTSIFLPVFSLLFSGGFLCYGLRFYNIDRSYNPIENGIYGCLNRTLFVLPYACLCCVYFTSGSSRFEDIFRKKGIIMCSRLTYCVYVVGPCFQLYTNISQKTYMNASDRIIAYWKSTADIIWGFVIAFFVYLTIEGPSNNLRKRLERKIIERFERKQPSTARSRIYMKDFTRPAGTSQLAVGQVKGCVPSRTG